jgi:hypothetical protein
MSESIQLNYKGHSQRFRHAWNSGREQAQIAHIALNDMIRSLRREHPDWSINHISQKIAEDHTDLEGFSVRQITRELDSENRKLIQKKTSSRDDTKIPRKDIEKSNIPSPEKPYYEEAKPVEQSEDNKELNKQMEKRHGLPVTEVVAKRAEDQDWEAEYRKDQGGLGSLDKAEPFIVAIVEKDLTAARDLVMRQLTKLKGQGWHVIELTPRYIS